jgi:hypothetical protein
MIKKELCYVPYELLTSALSNLTISPVGGNLNFLAYGIKSPALILDTAGVEVLSDRGWNERARYQRECEEKGVIPFSSAHIRFDSESRSYSTIKNINLEDNRHSQNSTFDRALYGGKPHILKFDGVYVWFEGSKGKELMKSVQEAGYLVNSGKVVFSFREEKEKQRFFTKKVLKDDSYLDINSKLELVIGDSLRNENAIKLDKWFDSIRV